MSAIRIAVKRLPERLRGFDRPDPEDLLHAGRVSVWVRWFLLGAALVDSNYRIDYGAPSHIFNTGYVLGIMAVNGYVQYLIQRNGTAKPVWLFGLSAMDLAFISFSTSLSGGFSSPYFPAYYFVVVMFAWVFSSPGLTLSWTTLVVVVYSVLSVTVEPGISILDKDERDPVLQGRLTVCSRRIDQYHRLREEPEKARPGARAGTTPADNQHLAGNPRHHRPMGLHGRLGRRGRHGTRGQFQR